MKAPEDLTKEQLIRNLTELRSRISELEQSEEDKRKYQEELSRTKAMFEGLFEFAPDAIIVVSRDGNIVQANKQAEQLFGYSKNELLNVHHEILLPERFREKHMEHRRKYMSGPRIRPMGTGLKLYGRRKDGSEFPVDIALGPLKAEEDMVVLAVIRDVSVRKQAEDALQHRDEELRLIMDTAPALISYIDVDYRYRRVNRSYERWFGQTTEQMQGHHVREVLGEAAWEAVRPYMQRALTGETVTYERELPYQGGGNRWVHVTYTPDRDESGRVRGFVVHVVDIEERKQAEEQIRRSNELSDALNDLNVTIHSTLDVNAIMQKVVADAAKAVGVDGASIGLFEDDSFIIQYAYNLPQELVNRALSSSEVKGIHHVASVRDVVVFEDARRDERLNVRFWSRFNIRSMMVAPLIVKERVIGALSFYCIETTVICTGEHVDFTRKLAFSISLALENAHLFDDRKRMEEEMRHMAHHDVLTGLPNRRLFIDIITLALAEARRRRKKLALLFLDLDRFKEINDTLGHEAGDALLKQVSVRLKSDIRGSDAISRIGGDEFNIILADITRVEDMGDIARKIVESFRAPFAVAGRELHITTSIGISIYPDDSEEIDTLLRYADMAMYHAKESGRNTYQFYNPAINTRSLERMRLEGMLRRTIERGELVVYYQPQVSVETRQMVCAEALVRWQHPERGLLDPMHFISVAEESGFITAIDEWVLRTACGQIKAWQEAGLPLLCITVNLSERQLLRTDFPDKIMQILHETEFDPHRLTVEVAESTSMQNIEKTIPAFKKLAEMGVGISIDDFGTGYSSLSCLKKLPIQKLKIDRSFIQDIATDPDNRTIISTVIAMAHNLKLTVIAEGVETEDQRSFLREAGCEEMQGYLFSGPVPAEEFRELIAPGK